MLNMFKPMDIRTVSDNKRLGSVFGWIGGYTNGVALLVLGNTVAHMSGNLANLGKGLGQLRWEDVFVVLPLLCCFILGAALGSYIYKKYGHVPILVAEAFLLMIMGDVHIKIAVIFGGLAMGLQNAFTTCASRDTVRTSHLTSTSTDIGISLARGDKNDVVLKTITIGSYMFGAMLGVFVSQFWGINAFTFAAMSIFALLIADRLSVLSGDDIISRLSDKFCKIFGL